MSLSSESLAASRLSIVDSLWEMCAIYVCLVQCTSYPKLTLVALPHHHLVHPPQFLRLFPFEFFRAPLCEFVSLVDLS